MKLNNYQFTEKIWFQILVSSLWFLILATGGLLDIKPLWFRITLIPILGVPAGLFYIWSIKNKSHEISFGEYVSIVLFVGPVLSIIFGILLGAAIYFIFIIFGVSLSL